MQAVWHFGYTLSELLCAINPKAGAKAELLHMQFYEAVLGEFLGVRNSSTNQKVLLGFERFPLESHFWQRIHHHNQVRAVPSSRLDKLAVLDGCWKSSSPHRVEALSGTWRSDVRRFIDKLGPTYHL